MVSERRFKNDAIYKVLKSACHEIYSDDESKALALLRKHNRLRAQLLRMNSDKEKLFRSMHLIFNKNAYDLVDLMTFAAITQVKIIFRGEFAYLNDYINVKSKEERDFFIIYDSNQIFDTNLKNNAVCAIDKRVPGIIATISFDKILSRIKRHLFEQIRKNGINPLPSFGSVNSFSSKIHTSYFSFKNTNFLSYVNDDPVILNEDTAADNAIYTDADVKPITVTEENIDCFYDIDGFHGFSNKNELKAFKELFELKYSKNNKKSPITQKRYISDKRSIKDLKKLYSVHFAEMFLPCVGGERINFYFIFDFEEKSASKKLCDNIREVIYDEILLEIRDTLKTNRLKHCNLSFMKTKSESQSSLQADPHSDIIDLDCLLTGKIDSIFISNILDRLSAKLPNEKIMIFFETYGTKNIFSDVSMKKIVSKFNNIIDLSILNVYFDVCCNLGIKGLKNKTICCPEELINYAKYGIEYYYLFNCSDFATFHGSTVKKNANNSASDLITLHANGISKINIYVPLLTQYLPRNFRNITFPCYTANLASSDFYGWTASANIVKKMNKMISNLKKTRENINQHMNLNISLRAEFRISSVNVPVFNAFANQLFINRELRYCETKKLIHAIQQGIGELISRLNEAKNITIEKLVQTGIYEVFYLEQFIK